MSEQELEAMIRDAARGYRVPGDPPLEVMWQEIERAHWGREGATRTGRGSVRLARVAPWLAAGIGMAATLLIGIAIGRGGVVIEPASAVAETTPAGGRPESTPYVLATGRHLDQAAALLVALPSETGAGRASTGLVEQAHDLLSTTRILLDSPAAEDPEIRSLLRDLELVLAQVSRLSTRGSEPAEVQLIEDAILERDVLPRLRTVAAELPITSGP